MTIQVKGIVQHIFAGCSEDRFNIFQIFEKFVEFVLSPACKTETYMDRAPRCNLLYCS